MMSFSLFLQVSQSFNVPCIVNVKEITVKESLNNASYPSNPIDMAFVDISVDPVDKIQGTVSTQCKQVVSCDCLGFTSALEHE